MKKIKVANTMIEHIPKYKVNTQKLIFFIFSKIEKKEILEKIKKGEGLELEVSKKELYEIFFYVEEKRRRRAFYEAKKDLHNIITISNQGSYIESSFLAHTEEKRRQDTIYFYLPKHIVYCLADINGQFFTADFLCLVRMKRRWSLALYQFLQKEKFRGKVKISPQELNELMDVNLQPANIKQYIQQTRDDMAGVGCDIDFTFELEKKGKKARFFIFNIFEKMGTLAERAKKEEKEVIDLYSSIIGVEIRTKQLIITNRINKFTEFQSFYFYELLKNKRKEIDKNIIMKVEGVCLGNKDQYYYNVICNAVLILDYSDISKIIDNCIIEIQKGKIKSNIAFVLSRIKEKIKNITIL